MDKLHFFKKIGDNIINLRKIKNFREYSDNEITELISHFIVGSLDYDQIIDRLFFYDDDDNREWRNRTDSGGYTIIPARTRFDSRFREQCSEKFLVNV